MSDLIDRQAAIDAYGDWYVEEGTEDGFIGTVKQLLEGFPSAQLGTNLAEVGTDCISRQAAIDEIRKCRFVVDAIEKIRGLPSAEPKTGEWIHDGYDFPHGNDWIHCSVCGKRGINVPADLTNFCPNCGSKMVREDGEANE